MVTSAYPAAAEPTTTSLPSAEEFDLSDLCQLCVQHGASDLHLTVGLPPVLRVNGRLLPLPMQRLDGVQTQRLAYDVLTDHQMQKFEETHELDFSFGVRDIGRFRANLYVQRGSVAAALRAIPTRIPSMEELNLPHILRDLTMRASGLILVTGYTGSGKSTSLATMVDHINRTRDCHIVTIEDPIEYLHRHQMSMINQRELGSDTYSFTGALRGVLREDPDVVLVGELRDLETVEAALTIAETGHLVFGTLHTRNSTQTVDRIVDVFPPHQQEQVRVMLANTLEAVIAQQLIPTIDGRTRLPAVEILIATSAIRNLIREAKTHQMTSVVETSAQIGMQTMDAALVDLVQKGLIAHEEAMLRCIDPDNFQRLLMGRYT